MLLKLAKRVVADGEGASKFVTINVLNSKTEQDAKKIGFSIANSPLVKTAIAGEDPNWGRIIMAIGKAGPKINLKKLCIKLGNIKIVQDGKLYQNYSEEVAAKYMKNENIEISVEVYTGKKDFTSLKAGAILDDGDKIRTGNSGFVAIIFIDDKSTLKTNLQAMVDT